jgi:hypothetical protein
LGYVFASVSFFRGLRILGIQARFIQAGEKFKHWMMNWLLFTNKFAFGFCLTFLGIGG